MCLYTLYYYYYYLYGPLVMAGALVTFLFSGSDDTDRLVLFPVIPQCSQMVILDLFHHVVGRRLPVVGRSPKQQVAGQAQLSPEHHADGCFACGLMG
jgi:hypothetical protein